MSRIICAICYEDAKPGLEDLQSISLCGHVFHELCLQQWLEYCPRGTKPTCPLCKQKCSGKDAHRLFFQTAAELSQAKSLPCASSCPDSKTAEVLQATIQKLEGQLSLTKIALAAHQEQLSDLNVQLSHNVARVEKAEAAQAEANREKANCKEAISKIQEELKRSTAERCKLLEKNTAMAKDIATFKLVTELDLNEDDVVQLARFGRGANKDDIIDTLRKSLVLRNRTYKELMVRCNELGMGENRAMRKYGKAHEQLHRLKARVHELEMNLEDKENAVLRAFSCGKISSPNKWPVPRDPGFSAKINMSTKPSKPMRKPKFLDTNCTELGNFQHQQAAPSLQDDGPMWGLNTLDGPNYLKEHSIGDAGWINGENSTEIEYEDTVDKENQVEIQSASEDSHRIRTWNNGSMNITSAHGTGVDISPLRSSSRKVLENFSMYSCFPGDSTKRQAQLVNTREEGDADQSNRTEGSLISSSVMWEDQVLMDALDCNSVPLPIRKEAGLLLVGQHESQPSESSGGASGNFDGGISRNLEGHMISVGKWCKSATSDTKNNFSLNGQLRGSAASSFICFGADGRGGRVKVLKPAPPRLEIGGLSNQSRPMKRCRIPQNGRHSVTQERDLQIEHFFARSAS